MRKVMQIQLHTLCTQVYAVRQSAAVLMLRFLPSRAQNSTE